MGFFGSYVFADGGWRGFDVEGWDPSVAEPWLAVTIHDSDFAVVGYAPRGSGSGVAYLGFTPRVYFEDDEASAPTDVSREAGGLAEWWAARAGGDPASKRAELAGFLAGDDDLDDDEPESEEDDDEAEVFVEIKTARFLRALALPVPADLPDR